MAPLVIRPSSLPGWQDCPGRTAAQLFRPLILEAGFELRSPPVSIGAHIGTGVHSGAAFTLEEKIRTGGELGNEAEAIDKAHEAFVTRSAEEGCRPDNESPNESTALKQISRMVKVYRSTLAPQIDPVAVESRLEADLGDGFIVSGQSDAVAREPNRLRDLKTGKSLPVPGPQLGCYSMLRRTHGFNDVDELTVDYIRRVAIGKDQPPPEIHIVPIDVAENMAVDIIHDMKASVAEFRRRLEQGGAPPEMAFRRNPSSNLCSEKWCAAWGTKFCRAHAGAK